MIKVILEGIEKNVPAPTVFEAVLNPQQKTAERNANGRLMRETLPDKWSLTFEWKFSTPDEYYAWFAYLETLTRVDFFVRFPSPAGVMKQAEFYVSPISAKMINYSRGEAGWWDTLKCAFIEV